MNKYNSKHILSTASNLLGFCLVVLTSLKVTKLNELTIIDEITGVACMLLATASVFSFLSIRTTKPQLSFIFEKIADSIFMIALLLVFCITFIIAFSLMF